MPNSSATRGVLLGLLLSAAVLLLPASALGARTLYLANGDDGTDGQALVFPLGADGTPAAATQTVTEGGYLNGVSMSPDGKYLFMADYGDSTFLSYSVGTDGKLTPLPGSPKSLAAGSGPYGSAVTPDGRFVIVGDYDRSGVEALALGADGSLTQVPGGFLEVAPGAQPYMIAVSTDSRTIYVPDPSSDQVFAVRIAADGSLSAAPGSPYPTGSDPYEAAVTPDGKYLYVPNNGSSDVSAYAIAADGSLTAIPGSPFPVATDPYGGVAITPDGRTLYTSGSNEQIDVASIGADGTLSAGTPTPIGDYNPGLALSPDGKRLYNEVGGLNQLLTFSVGAGGALTAFGSPLALPATTAADIQSLVVSPDQPPVAAVITKPGKKANQIDFDASGSTDPDGTVASYAWDFGDGQSETTTSPTTAHAYAGAGDYTATVTLTDNEGCSTAIVYTGQTALCNGSTVARASAAVDSGVAGPKVKAKKTQKQKGKKVVVKVKVGAAEGVDVVAKGKITVKGSKKAFPLKQAKKKVAAGKTKTLKLKPKKAASSRRILKQLDAGKKASAKLSVRLTDDAGNSVTKKPKVKLK